MDVLYDKVRQYTRDRGFVFNVEECACIRSNTVGKVIPAHTIIMEQGKPVKKLYFLNEGIVRLFRVHNGVDYTLGLVSSNDFISTPLYLFNGQPSSCGLETLTQVNVLEWQNENLSGIKKEVKVAYELEMAVMYRLLNWVQDNQIDAICLSAEERYQKMLSRQPEIIRMIPLKYIASYLGIHQDSLSRIRKIVSQKP